MPLYHCRLILTSWAFRLHVLKSFSGYRTALSNRPTQLYEELHAAYNCVEFSRQNCDTGLQYVQM
jgi:hypothetical protein